MSFLHFSLVFQTSQTAERVRVPCTSKTRPSGFTREIGTALRSFNENFHNYFTNISSSFRSATSGGYDWLYRRLRGDVGSRS